MHRAAARSGRWIASDLPAWSSRPESAATYAIGLDGLGLSIPPEQGLWCAAGPRNPSGCRRCRRATGPVRLVGIEDQPHRSGKICLIDVSERHRYAVDGRPGRVDFVLDGDRYRTVEQAPDYPMRLMVGVFPFPASAAGLGTAAEVPELTIPRVTGGPR